MYVAIPIVRYLYEEETNFEIHVYSSSHSQHSVVLPHVQASFWRVDEKP